MSRPPIDRLYLAAIKASIRLVGEPEHLRYTALALAELASEWAREAKQRAAEEPLEACPGVEEADRQGDAIALGRRS